MQQNDKICFGSDRCLGLGCFPGVSQELGQHLQNRLSECLQVSLSVSSELLHLERKGEEETCSSLYFTR